jgi:hypothetical protein
VGVHAPPGHRDHLTSDRHLWPARVVIHSFRAKDGTGFAKMWGRIEFGEFLPTFWLESLRLSLCSLRVEARPPDMEGSCECME